MDWLQFISSVVAAVAWPAALVTLALIFRTQFVSLAERVTELSLPWGTKATFAEGIEKARETAEEAATQSQVEAAPSPPAPSLEIDDPYLELANKYPDAAIMQSYKEVESVIQEYMIATKSGRRKDIGSIIKLLAMLGYIDSSVEDLFRQVRELRNIAVHGGALAVTAGEALEYRSLCQRLISLLRPALTKVRAVQTEKTPEWARF